MRPPADIRLISAPGTGYENLIKPQKDTDKFVSYTNANKEGAGNDVNRARFRFLYPSLCMWCAATLIVFSVDVRNGPAGWPGGQSGRSEEM